jgi:hypothetical protein
MFISNKGAFIKNISLAIANSLITLILLLIAPLGLAAVISNTIAVGFSSLMVATFFDLVVLWLLEGQGNKTRLSSVYREQPFRSISEEKSQEIQTRDDF